MHIRIRYPRSITIARRCWQKTFATSAIIRGFLIEESHMRAPLRLFLGVPIPIIILIALFVR